jgi:sporulation protein YlmC with PRC-barrel domain
MTLQLGLQVLDRQLLTVDKELCGKVDDIELDREDGSIRPAALLIGVAAWPERLPVPLRAPAARLLRGEVARIEWDEIAEMSATIRLKLSAQEVGRRSTGLPRDAGRGRLATLLGAMVVGADGRHRGRVREVEAGGPSRGVKGPRVTAILVGRAGLLRRLGLPTRRSEFGQIPWSEVSDWSGGTIKLRS